MKVRRFRTRRRRISPKRSRTASKAVGGAPGEVLARVGRAIQRVRPELTAREVTPKASLVGDLGVDSLALAELSLALEDEFHRPIFLGDVLADLEDPASLTVGQLASRLAREP